MGTQVNERIFESVWKDEMHAVIQAGKEWLLPIRRIRSLTTDVWTTKDYGSHLGYQVGI